MKAKQKQTPAHSALTKVMTLGSCTALIIAGPIMPAQAEPGAPAKDSRPAIPSAQDIENAKRDASSTSAEIAKLESLIEAASEDLQKVAADGYRAANGYSEALVTLMDRQAAAATARSKAQLAEAANDQAQAELGQLAGAMYKTGGVDATVQTLLGVNEDSLYQTSTLLAVGKNRARTVNQAQIASNTAAALREAADQAQKAADDAAATADQAKKTAEDAYAAQNHAVSQAQEQRGVLIGQLATLKNTTVELESARIEGLERQRQQEQLATVIAASRNMPESTPPSPTTTLTPGSNQGTSTLRPPAQPPAVVTLPPPAVNLPRPPAVQPPVAPPPPPVTPPTGTNIQGMVNFAMSKVGARYKWGGTGPEYDCSGLIWAAFRSVGINVPRTGTDQFWKAPQRVPLEQARYGDILAFNYDGSRNFTHVGIYLGNGTMVNALNPHQGVLVVNLNYLVGLKIHTQVARY